MKGNIYYINYFNIVLLCYFSIHPSIFQALLIWFGGSPGAYLSSIGHTAGVKPEQEAYILLGPICMLHEAPLTLTIFLWIVCENPSPWSKPKPHWGIMQTCTWEQRRAWYPHCWRCQWYPPSPHTTFRLFQRYGYITSYIPKACIQIMVS